MASVVSPIMPPMMPVPIEWRAFAPAPMAMASGRTPKMNAAFDLLAGMDEVDENRIGIIGSYNFV